MSKLQHCFIIRSPHGNSRIYMEEDGFCKLRSYIDEHYKETRIAVITDGNVAPIFHDRIRTCLPEAMIVAVEPGERSKTMKVAEQLCQDLLEDGFTRNSVVIGLGGGMITDLAGFVASIYMRGVPFIAMPTTLLGMIDAAIGGKTGVNLGAKNIIGTFYPAEAVLIDQAFLKTLPEREMKTGMAEAIKYAAILDASLEGDLMAKKPDFRPILEKSIATKVRVCNEDMKEGGLRKVLNFGHTFGHAIEYMSRYKLSHGEAISIGMVLANKIAQKLGKQSKAHGDRITEMLKKHGLPTEMPKKMKLRNIIEMIYKDKKMEGQKVTFILSTKMGQHEMVKLAPDELRELLR
ncbi:MAG: 3-dehydroquinate synthase [Patescibacteria group bacterium]